MARIIDAQATFNLNGKTVKYFFLAENWTTGRVWEFGGLWNELAWHRKPYLSRQSLYIQENGENLWLYKAEEAILMIEVMPRESTHSTIGQVVLKRLLTAEQVIERLCQEDVFHPSQPAPSLGQPESEQPEIDLVETGSDQANQRSLSQQKKHPQASVPHQRSHSQNPFHSQPAFPPEQLISIG